MRIAVVGAAGRTGALVVEQAVAAGHAVTAVARTASRVAAHAGVRLVEGDVSEPEVAARAVRDQDAVICAVAAPGRGASTAVSGAVTALVRAMEVAGPRRLVVTSSRNLVATRPAVVVVPTRWLLRHVYADLRRAEDVVRGSGLDWTLARATRLVDQPARGGVWTDLADDAEGGDWQLPRADLARALLDQVEEGRHVGEAVGINGLPR